MSTGKPQSFRIVTRLSRPSADLVALYERAATATVCDAGPRVRAMHHRIRPLLEGVHIIGPAMTVWTQPGSNLIVWHAVEIAQPGDILVVATGAHESTSTFGDRLVLAAKARGLAGIVSDGLCRDRTSIRALGLPTFAAGSIPTPPGKYGPGEIGVRISCGGVAVDPGDLMVADDDGVVVVPYADVRSVGEGLVAVEEKESRALAAAHAGEYVPRWVAEAVLAEGCDVVD